MSVVGGSIFLGWKADEWLDSSPLGILSGLLIGFAVGFYYLFVTLFKSEKDGEEALPEVEDSKPDGGSELESNAPGK